MTPITEARLSNLPCCDPRSPGGDGNWVRALDQYQAALQDLVVDVVNPENLTEGERSSLATRLSRTNMVVYRCAEPHRVGRAEIAAMASQLGLNAPDHNLLAANDGLSEIEVKTDARSSQYIPYTDRVLNWHTDGYYHTQARTIRTMLLHCIRPAETGGALEAIDHRVIYALLKHQDSRFIDALSQDDVMLIPENRSHGASRDACTGPVFFSEDGVLRMRYTARKHNIVWKNEGLVSEALAALEEILDGSVQFRFQIGRAHV